MNEDLPPKHRGPVLIELDQPAPDSPRRGPHLAERSGTGTHDGPSPADAPPVEDAPDILPRPRTMEMVTRLVSRPPSRLTRFFLNAGVALFTFLLSVAALGFINDLMGRYPLLGWVGAILFGLFTLAALLMALREYRAWARFGRIDAINRHAGAALADDDVQAARAVAKSLDSLYAKRPEMGWGRARLAEHLAGSYDARTLLSAAETDLLSPLDEAARREVEAAARTVAAATALIPLALADVAAALAANLRMIRRIAEIYGGRAGAVGGWRLARTVMTHLIATGAVAAGDDLIHTMAGGGALAKISRRFGEGVVNGALTARVGIAAIEVCRPMPFIQQPRPKVTNLVSRGLKGLFGQD